MKQQGVHKQQIERFQQILNDEEYDTESMEADLMNDQKEDGNIARALDHKHSVSSIQRMLQSAKASSSAFAAGYRFYYWPAFKNKSDEPDRSHPEYKMSELYVKQKYSSFKEEIANYQAADFDVTTYNNTVRVKALVLMDSNIVKKTNDTESEFLKHDYGIPKGSTMAFRHLIAVIMYCDYTHLSSKFTATFRKNNAFEQLHGIKRRNSEYWWFSRALRETVEIFGRSYRETQEAKHPFVGPFYCGMSFVMTVPEFSIRLNGPTSTTMHDEVAMKFSGPDGIIMTLNNQTLWGEAKHVHGFDCSWVSRYTEEDERLFFGGHALINIESIWIIRTNQNFRDIIYALCYLDKMVDGIQFDVAPISAEQISAFSVLFTAFLDGSTEIDEYIRQTLGRYGQNKKRVQLNLDLLWRHANGDMANLIMNEMQRSSDNSIRGKDDQTNLPNSAFFKMFSNVKQLRIDTMAFSGGYSISLLHLLLHLQGSSIRKVEITGEDWLEILWSNEQERDAIVRAYKTQQYHIQFDGAKFDIFKTK